MGAGALIVYYDTTEDDHFLKSDERTDHISAEMKRQLEIMCTNLSDQKRVTESLLNWTTVKGAESAEL